MKNKIGGHSVRFQQTGRNEHCLRVGNCKNLEVISFLVIFCLKYGQRNNRGEKRRGHRVGFKIIPLLC